MSLAYLAPETATYQRQGSLAVSAVAPPLGSSQRSPHAGLRNPLEMPDLGAMKRQDEFSHTKTFPNDPWSMPLTMEAIGRGQTARRAAGRKPETPIYAKRSLPRLARSFSQASARANKAVRSQAEFKGLLRLDYVGPEPDDDGPPPYAAQLVQAAILRKMKEVRKKNPHAVSQGCFIQLQGVPTKWLQRGYHEWTDAPPDLLSKLPPPE